LGKKKQKKKKKKKKQKKKKKKRSRVGSPLGSDLEKKKKLTHQPLEAKEEGRL